MVVVEKVEKLSSGTNKFPGEKERNCFTYILVKNKDDPFITDDDDNDDDDDDYNYYY